jgi:hypothetical protein
MGATNALNAYRRWAGKVPATSLQLLVYMALVSKDAQDWPWYAQGQHALAEHGLGRSDPDEADLRAVQRALSPLLKAEAVTVDRAGASRSNGNTTARYRLNLHERADRERLQWLGTPDGKRRASDRRGDRQHPTKNGGDTRRFVTTHPTVCDDTPDGNRRPKETRGNKRSEKTKEEVVDPQTASHPSRAHTDDAEAEPSIVVELFPRTTQEAPYRRRRWSTPGLDELARASEVRRAAVAAHQAGLEAQ